MIRKFASELDSWLQAALEDLPENLRAVKIDRKNLFLSLKSTIIILKIFFILYVQLRDIFVTCSGDKVPSISFLGRCG